MKHLSLGLAVAATLVAGAANAANPVVIGPFDTPQPNGNVPVTAQLDGCAVADGAPITINWSMGTESSLDLVVQNPGVESSTFNQTVTQTLQLGSLTLADNAPPCPGCEVNLVLAPPFLPAGTEVIEDALDANFSGSVQLTSGSVYDALSSGGSATVSYLALTESIFSGSGNFGGDVTTESQARVSCTPNDIPPPPPPPVPAISAAGLAFSVVALPLLGLFGLRRRG